MTNTHPYLITGRKHTGGSFDRYPIETLQSSHPEQFTLFILAYLSIQDRTTSFKDIVDLEPVSPSSGGVDGPLPRDPGAGVPAATFLQIGGIHGLPYQEYAGDPRTAEAQASDYNGKDKKDTDPVPSRFGGYCNHGSVFFPTWHRPYVLLIEQAIGNAAEKIANALEKHNRDQRGKWIRAARELRFPYWDWAESNIAADGLPPVLYTDTIQIALPNGLKREVPNPIAYFTFKKIPDGFQNEPDPSTIPAPAGTTAYFADWKRTYRYAKSSPNPGDSDISELQVQLKQQAEDLRNKVAHLFTFNSLGNGPLVWDEFSNHTTESLRDEDYYNAGSLEGVHDSVHNILGGNGHMADPDYAGFDPIFFLHHSNVDRLFALWEYCYKDYWMEKGYVQKGTSYPWTQARGTYFEVYNEQILPDSALAPFRNGADQYWTSTQTRFLDEDAYPKYYSYPSIAGVKVDRTATSEERVAARSRLQKYYGLDPHEAAKKLTATEPALFKKQVSAPPANHAVIQNYRHFIVLVQLPEHAFNRSYSFRLYQKPLGSDGEEIIGTVTVFARPDHSACKGCALRRDAGSIVRGVIVLPSLMVDSIIKSKEGLNDADVDETVLTNGIKSELVGKLMDARGGELASAEAGGAVSPVPDEDAIPRHMAPVKTVLLSAAVAHPEGDEHGPVTMFDWKNHGEIFSNGWKKSGN